MVVNPSEDGTKSSMLCQATGYPWYNHIKRQLHLLGLHPFIGQSYIQFGRPTLSMSGKFVERFMSGVMEGWTVLRDIRLQFILTEIPARPSYRGGVH